MTISNWLRSLHPAPRRGKSEARRDTGNARRPSARRLWPNRPLSLERLEDRTVPAGHMLGHHGFGPTGQVTTAFTGALDDGAVSVLVQGDGKIVAAGRSDMNFALARYTTGGAPDSTFGSGGKVSTIFAGISATLTDAALEPDGKIVAAGYYSSGSVSGLLLARYTTSGNLDSSFGSEGKVLIPVVNDGFDKSLAIQADGKILVADSVYTGPITNFVVSRFTVGGALDGTFGTGGTVATGIGPNGFVGGIALTADGHIVVGGSSHNYTVPASNFVVAQFTSGGVLDATFGTGGKVSTVYSQNGFAEGLALQSDGHIVVAGYGQSAPTYAYTCVLARYSAGGVLDSGFGSGGLASTSGIFPQGIAVQADDKVLVAGQSLSPYGFGVARFTTGGILDAGFGTGGIVSTPIAGYATSVALQSDGKVIAAGNGGSPDTGGDFAVARYSSAGVLDAGFGAAGVATTNFVGQVDAVANSLAADDNGHFLVGGATTSGGYSLAVGSYHDNGRLDDSFNHTGTAQVSFGAPFGPFFGDGFVATTGGNKTLLVGTALEPGTSNYDFALARFDKHGQLDPTFGVGGKVTTFSGASTTDLSPSGGVVVQHDGKILVAGYQEYFGGYPSPPYTEAAVVVRYNPNGSLDTSFGSGGRSVVPFTDSYYMRVTGLALTTGGKILLDGFSFDANTGEETDYLERLNTNGSVDTGFGTGGQVNTGLQTFGAPLPLAVRPDGRILIGETTSTFDGTISQSYFTVAQFTAAGAVDASFGTGGQGSVAIGSGFNIDTFTGNFVDLRGITLQSNGQVVAVGGNFYQSDNTVTSTFAVARLRANGQVDNTFGNHGTVTTNFNNNDEAVAALVRPNGVIVVAGYTFDSAQQHYVFALASYGRDGSPGFCNGGGNSPFGTAVGGGTGSSSGNTSSVESVQSPVPTTTLAVARLDSLNPVDRNPADTNQAVRLKREAPKWLLGDLAGKRAAPEEQPESLHGRLPVHPRLGEFDLDDAVFVGPLA